MKNFHWISCHGKASDLKKRDFYGIIKGWGEAVISKSYLKRAWYQKSIWFGFYFINTYKLKNLSIRLIFVSPISMTGEWDFFIVMHNFIFQIA